VDSASRGPLSISYQVAIKLAESLNCKEAGQTEEWASEMGSMGELESKQGFERDGGSAATL